MRVADEASLTLDVVGDTLHLIVGSPRPDGAAHCHLLSEDGSTAFSVVVDLTGRLSDVRGLFESSSDAPETLAALSAVDPARWRAGLAVALSRRIDLFRQLQSAGDLDDALPRALRRTQAMLAAVESDDPVVQPRLAALAPTWEGTVQELHDAARPPHDT